MGYFLKLYGSLNFTLCMAVMMLAALAVVLGIIVTMRRKRERTEREIRCADGAGKEGGRKGGGRKARWPWPEVVSINLVMVLCIAVVAAYVMDQQDRRMTRFMVKNGQGSHGAMLGEMNRTGKLMHAMAKARLNRLLISREQRMQLSSEADLRLPSGNIHGMEPDIVRRLESLRAPGYHMERAVLAIWLVLGAVIVVLLIDLRRMRAGMHDGLWTARAGRMWTRAGGRLWLALPVLVAAVLWLLAGKAAQMAAIMDSGNFPTWKSARVYLNQVREMYRENLIERRKAAVLMAEADRLEVAKGLRVITPEQRRAFLEATSGLPKAPVQVLSAEDLAESRRMAGLTRVLLLEAGYGGSSDEEFLPKPEVLPRLLEALRETGIAPDAVVPPERYETGYRIVVGSGGK